MIALIEKLTTEQKRQICLAEIERNRRELTGLAYTVLGDWHYAEDAVQDVAVKVLTTPSQLKDESKIYTWLGRITINEGKDFYRRNDAQSKRPTNGGIILVGYPDYGGLYEPTDKRTSNSDEYSSLRTLIYQELGNLNPVFREAFVLNVFEDMNCREIGELLGVKQNTVWMRAERAKMQLASRLMQQGYGA